MMNESGAAKVMQSKFTVGGTAQAAAGPVGRTATAETDAQMRAEILSYSRARGLFASAACRAGRCARISTRTKRCIERG